MTAKNQRLDATISIGSVLQRSVGKNLNVLRRGLDSVGDEIKQITDRQREMSKQRRILERQGRSVEDLDREYEDLGRTLDELRRKQERFERATRDATRVGRTFTNMTAEIGRFGRRAAVGIGAAGAGVFGLARSTATAADDMERLSALSNTSAGDFQRMAVAAESVGIGNEKLADILKDVNDRVGDFVQTGGGPMADFFEKVAPKVGVTAEHFRDLSGADALQLYVDTLERANLSQQDMTFFLEAMASDATALIPILSNGGAEMDRLADAAERAGRIIDDDTIAASRDFRDAMRDATGAVRGLRNIIGSELMPVVTDAMVEFTSFMASNRDEVDAFARSFSTGVGDAIPIVRDLASGVGAVASKLGEGAAKLAKFVGGWENLGIIVGGLFAGKVVLSALAFAGAVGSLAKSLALLAAPGLLTGIASGLAAIGAVLVANPIGATLAAIGLAAGLIVANWERIKPVLQPVIDWLGERVERLGAAVEPVVGAIADGAGLIQRAWSGAAEFLGGVMDEIAAAFERAWARIEPVIEGLKWVIENGAEAVEMRLDPPLPAGSGGRRDAREAEGGVQQRAIGGALRSAVPTLVGERGPELIYPTQGGFVAHNRALERLTSLSERAAGAMAAPAQAARQVVQNITINAPQGTNVEALVAEIDRRRREAENDALFDGATGWGQYA